MDREGHLLTFADLGRDRGSFDWLSPVVFSGLVLHVELCDRQRNRTRKQVCVFERYAPSFRVFHCRRLDKIK